MPKLSTIDLSILEGRPLPERFKQTVYCAQQVMAICGYEDVSTFWLDYRTGLIPPAVWLPVEPNTPCWDKQLIDEWLECGKPVAKHIILHQDRIFRRLVAILESELPDRPPLAIERN